jgi:HD-like signal output (HDOD) protein
MLMANDIVSMVKNLVSLPGTYSKVRQLVEDPNSSPDQLARVIAVDPAITARLLRLANSAFWGRGGRIETVSRAVRLLGMNHVHDLVLATSVATAFRGLDPSVIDLGRFWRASVYRALAAASLAAKREFIDLERLFLEGLLCDVGHLVMYQAIPTLAAQVEKQARAQPWSVAEFESALIGCDYAQVGAALAEAWLLPDCFVKTIAHQQEPWTSATHPLEAGVVHITRWLWHRLDRYEGKSEQPPLAEAVVHLVALPAGAIEEAATEAEGNLAAMVQLFTPVLAAA